MARLAPLFLALLTVAGCGSAIRASFQPASGAPTLEPAESTPAKVDRVPERAKDLGLVEVSGDESTSATVCEQRMLAEAQHAGANVVVVRFSEGGSESRPAGCHGEAYYVPNR
jgi:hypothetical protein